MLELIETYSFKEILLFLVIFASAIKGVVSFWAWGYERLKKMFKKENDEEKEKSIIQKQLDENREEINDLKNSQSNFQDTLKNLLEKINLLLESDKDDIKSFITREHHYFCYQKEWIDDYSLDCIEKRFKHYIKEGGNSFVEDLMKELRGLPKQPQE